MGRMFRPSWGRDLTLLTLNTQDQISHIPLRSSFEKIGTYVSGRLSDDISSVSTVQCIQILGGNEKDVETFEVSIAWCLFFRLANVICALFFNLYFLSGKYRGTPKNSVISSHYESRRRLSNFRRKYGCY